MSKNGFENAKGVFPWQPGDEPSEITIRKLRDGGPFWIWVEQWLPPLGETIKVTDGEIVCNGYIGAVTKKWCWHHIGKFGGVIAWLYEPDIPQPPTIEEHEKWLEWSGHKARP